MRNLFGILIFLTASLLTQESSAVTYSCPNGGTLSGTTCTVGSNYAATPNYSCPSGGALSGTTCTISGNYTATATSYWLGNGIKWPSLAQCSNSCNGGRITCSNWCKTGMDYSCPSGGTLVGATCYTSSAYTATTNYSCSAGHTLSGTTCSFIGAYTPPPLQCNPGDTLSGTTCTHIATASTTTHNLCVDADGNGVTDPFQSGSEFVSPATCRPDLKTSTAQFLYNCLAESGDPTGAAWYLLTGTTHVQTVTQSQTLSAPICRYDPPVIDGTYSYSTFSCASPNQQIGQWCRPPIQTLSSIKTTERACALPDVLNGVNCVIPLAITASVNIPTYSCNTTADYPNITTMMCVPPSQQQSATSSQQYICGPNAQLNTSTNKCMLIDLPAIASNGAWTCPAGYALSGSWCRPDPIQVYPADLILGRYECLKGGALGAIPGLCYL